MRHLTLLLMFYLIAGCASHTPRYREVTLLDNGHYAISSQSIDAFKSERDADQRARQYCQQSQLLNYQLTVYKYF